MSILEQSSLLQPVSGCEFPSLCVGEDASCPSPYCDMKVECYQILIRDWGGWDSWWAVFMGDPQVGSHQPPWILSGIQKSLICSRNSILEGEELVLQAEGRVLKSNIRNNIWSIRSQAMLREEKYLKTSRLFKQRVGKNPWMVLALRCISMEVELIGSMQLGKDVRQCLQNYLPLQVIKWIPVSNMRSVPKCLFCFCSLPIKASISKYEI